MLHSAPIAALVALALPGTAVADRPSVTLTACEPRDRVAVFEARMDKIPGSARMKLRFTLEARKRGRSWRRVAAPELRGWRTAGADATRFISTLRMKELVGPSYYRALVRFRWVDADGDIVATAKARSRACWQRDHRPNLKLRGFTIESGGRYLVHVANTGRTESGPFDLAITGLGPYLVVDGLQPHEERFVEIFGPACEPDAQVTATADPLDLVDERNERDNALTVLCP